MMKVKVCGMRDAENVRQVAALGIDMMGFIFYPKSPRCFKGLDHESQVFPRTEMEKKVKRVGVFVNDSFGNIEMQTLRLGLDAVQFHGNESPGYCKHFQEKHKELKVVKAISVATADDIQKYKEYVGAVDLFLFDTKCKAYGGSGEQFDWQVLEQYDGDTPFLLSGGIGLEDAERIKNFHHPKCVGIDLNSKFEIEPGLKDVEKLKEFLEKIKK